MKFTVILRRPSFGLSQGKRAALVSGVSSVVGILFHVAAVGFALMGVFSSRLSSGLRQKPRVVAGLNVGAGVAFVASGLSVAVLKQK